MSAPHPSAPHALGPEHACREHRLRRVQCTCMRSVYLGGGDAERARVRLVGRSEPAVCNWRRDFRKEVFPAYAHTLPFFDLLEKGVQNLFFGNRLDSAPRWSTVSLEAKACGIQAVSAYTALAAATIVHDVHDVT